MCRALTSASLFMSMQARLTRLEGSILEARGQLMSLPVSSNDRQLLGLLLRSCEVTVAGLRNDLLQLSDETP